MSVLITSATDALAFLVGSATVLPALSWFCQFSGLCVIFCFIFQMVIFLPCLALNAQRFEAGYLDCCCCCKVNSGGKDEYCKCHKWVNKEPPTDETHIAKYRPPEGKLAFGMRSFGRGVTTTGGKVFTMLFFAVLLGFGAVGLVRLKKDFKIEWFIPDNSYVREFFASNDKEFKSGISFTVYVGEMDYFANQKPLKSLYSYLNETDLTDRNEGVDSWHEEFMTTTRTAISNDPLNLEGSANWLDATTGLFKDKKTFWARLHNWYRDGSGVRYRGSMKWKDEACQNSTLDTWITAACNPEKGLNGTRLSAMIALKHR